MIDVITIEREFGSGGGAIARALATRLGWALWDHEFTCEIARRLKCDVASVERREERLDPTFYRLAKIFMRGSYEASFSGKGLDLLDSEHLSRLFETVVKDIAAKSRCVIVGRGAPWFLRDNPNAYHCFVYAPQDEKLRRLTAAGIPRAEIDHLLATVDQERAAFVKKYYAKSWPQRDLYHLMLNSKLGDPGAVELILHGISAANSASGARPAQASPASFSNTRQPDPARTPQGAAL